MPTDSTALYDNAIGWNNQHYIGYMTGYSKNLRMSLLHGTYFALCIVSHFRLCD